jgi:hypothetical protein
MRQYSGKYYPFFTGLFSGIVNKKLEPLPGALLAQIFPLCNPTTCKHFNGIFINNLFSPTFYFLIITLDNCIKLGIGVNCNNTKM